MPDPTPPGTRRRWLAAAALLVVAVVMGLTFLATKLALVSVHPFTLALLRFLVASAVLAPTHAILKRAAPVPKRLPWPTLALLGLTGVTLFFVFQNLGLVYTTASATSLILATTPALTAALSIALLREPMSLLRGLGIVVSVSGAAIIALSSAASGSASNPLLGDLLVFGAALSWTVYTVAGKRISLDVPPLTVITYGIFLGTALLVPFAAYECIRYGLPVLDGGAVFAILYLGIAASALAFFLFNFALVHVEASTAPIYLNLSPVVAVAGAVIFLGESFQPIELLGGFLIIAGVYVAERRHSATGPRKIQPPAVANSDALERP
jgi:drug/metabolite transporter (DMT)-like permease